MTTSFAFEAAHALRSAPVCKIFSNIQEKLPVILIIDLSNAFRPTTTAGVIIESIMDEMELFTVNVFQSPHHQPIDSNNPGESAQEPEDNSSRKSIASFQNMVSARVIKGRVLELEHSNLAGPDVKFKTVINYERTLDPRHFVGITFRPQDGYITKSDES